MSSSRPHFGGKYRRRDGRNDGDSRNRHGHSPRDAYRSYSSFDSNRDRDSDPRRPRDAPYSGADRGSDSYRPPQGDFTFRVDKPAGIQDANSYRPQNDRYGRNDRRDPDSRPSKRHRGPGEDSYRNGHRSGPGDRYRHGRDRPWRPFIAAEREILKANHNTGEDIELYHTANGVTYRPLDELSDSDEADMDISDEEGAAGDEPPAKRTRTAAEQSTTDNNVPKWSNPDPYTALPPETAPQGKKKDVVQLIRKARVQTAETRTSLPSDAADFIGLDSDSEDSEADNKDSEAPNTISDEESDDSHDGGPDKPASLPSSPERVEVHRSAFLHPDTLSSLTSSRKRTHDGEIKMPHARLKPANKKPQKGVIVDEWKPIHGLTPTPWLGRDHSGSANMAVWLHKEVVDFYEYIRPRDFEERLRQEVVDNLKNFCRKVYRDAEMYPFGSFPSGLYLPTADMDMVFMSDSYFRGGLAKYHTKSFMFRFRSNLISHGIAWNDEIELITRAKVPLVKFIENKTGLKIDVSFENSTGVTAINTFKAWRDQYPGMPALVTLIKHFLMMRGLNEPVNGGIGGFSVICLVVSMLQMMPEVQSGNLDTRHHLGQLLLRFFDLYGNKFNYERVAISLNPPRWIAKNKVTAIAYKNFDRLSIIDPNNPSNDISGGSSNTPTIVSLFAGAHKALTERMAQLAKDPKRAGQSILGVILGGNYTSFETQRNYLELLSKKNHSFRDSSSQAQERNSGSSRNLPPPPRAPAARKNSGGSRKRR
ncbi:hypothetical protein VTJ83DRAFT_5313 [Remersonia thermophila]|uniref:polynucleotide adenylyltransferase n=1 Tax=Remersonia thermophila TaxID=72144 RepID=A0ABR4D6H0_9PEZI